MMYGLTAPQFQFLSEFVLTPLNNKGAKVYLFGSRARGDHQKFSDIDLLVESQSDLKSLIGSLSEVLEASNFPFKVDIVEDHQLAESYRPSVEKDKVLL